MTTDSNILFLVAAMCCLSSAVAAAGVAAVGGACIFDHATGALSYKPGAASAKAVRCRPQREGNCELAHIRFTDNACACEEGFELDSDSGTCTQATLADDPSQLEEAVKALLDQQAALTPEAVEEAARGGEVTAADGLKIYGNWCGPLHGGAHGGPIDDIDRCCFNHDNCYASKGYLRCACDRQLVSCIDAARATTLVQKAAKIAVKAYFQWTPCFCSNKLPCKPIKYILSCNC